MEFDETDIVGKKFGKLTVESFSRKVRNEKYKHNKYYYTCKCDCGNLKEVQRVNLITNHTTSCGCLKKRTGKTNPCWNGHGEISGRLWAHIKKHAENRNLKFSLTIEEAWEKFLQQERKCAMTGIELSLKTLKGKENKYTASLDRIDNTKGYTVTNVQWLHKDVNWMKGKFELHYFIELCKAVAEYKKVL